MLIRLKRAYEQPAREDGTRILVERLWPRGLTKERAAVDLWLKEVAPSPELRQWFAHDPAKWAAFQERYCKELDARPEVVAELRSRLKNGPVTFVYGARDEEHNAAVALKAYIEQKRTAKGSRSGRLGKGKC